MTTYAELAALAKSFADRLDELGVEIGLRRVLEAEATVELAEVERRFSSCDPVTHLHSRLVSTPGCPIRPWWTSTPGCWADGPTRLETILHPELGRIDVDAQDLFTENRAETLVVLTTRPGTESHSKPELLSDAFDTEFQEWSSGVEAGAEPKGRPPGTATLPPSSPTPRSAPLNRTDSWAASI